MAQIAMSKVQRHQPSPEAPASGEPFPEGKKTLQQLSAKYGDLQIYAENDLKEFRDNLLGFDKLHFDMKDHNRGQLMQDNTRLMSVFRHANPTWSAIENVYDFEAWVLGSGTFGICFLAWHCVDGQNNVVAVKMLREKHLTIESERRRFRNEASCLRKLSTAQAAIGKQYLPGFQKFGFVTIRLLDGRTVQAPFLTMDLISFTAKHLAISVMKPALTSSKRQPPVGQPPSWGTLALIAREVARALAWLHSNHLLHTDLKHDNIWWNRQGEAGIMDVGCAVPLHPNSDHPNAPLHEWQATVKTHEKPLRYWLPEEVTRKPLGRQVVQVGPSCDWFAFGIWLVGMFYMVKRDKRHSPGKQISFAIRDVDKDILPEIQRSSQHRDLSIESSDVAGSVLAMVEALLQPNPCARPRGVTVLQVLDRLVAVTVKTNNQRKPKKPHKKTRRGKNGGKHKNECAP